MYCVRCMYKSTTRQIHAVQFMHCAVTREHKHMKAKRLTDRLTREQHAFDAPLQMLNVGRDGTWHDMMSHGVTWRDRTVFARTWRNTTWCDTMQHDDVTSLDVTRCDAVLLHTISVFLFVKVDNARLFRHHTTTRHENIFSRQTFLQRWSL